MHKDNISSLLHKVEDWFCSLDYLQCALFVVMCFMAALAFGGFIGIVIIGIFGNSGN